MPDIQESPLSFSSGRVEYETFAAAGGGALDLAPPEDSGNFLLYRFLLQNNLIVMKPLL